MINVSNEFNKTMAQRTDFTENAVITFVDGTVLELTEKDFTTSNNAIIDGAGSNGLPVGVAMCRSIQIELDNHDDRFSTYDFFGAKIRLYLTFKLSETTEKIEEGIFTVVSPETYGQTVIISAVDDMYKADKSYSTDLSFPANAGSVLRDVCSYCDIPLLSTSFDNDDFFIESKPDANIPCRQIIGYIAMISGGNARINRQGQLEIMHYDTQAFQKENLNGGVFQPWNSEEIVSGGSFNPWTESDVYSGGTFTDKYPYHILGYWKNIKVDTDDVVITGVSIKSGENTYLSGDTGYVLSFENTFITGKEQMVADYLGQKLIGIKFRKFEGDLVSNPLIEFMDPALIIDRKGNIYQTYITDVDFNFLGLTTLKNSAENAVRNSSKYYSESVKTLVEAKRLYEVEKNAREIAVENLANQLATSSGLYMTVESQLDGSNVYYMHDKPTISESMIVWKLTAMAFGISTDGGKTYPYGFTVDGQTITRLLYAEGINADYIDSGTMIADRINGGTLKVGGLNNENGVIAVYNAEGEQVGKWDKDGLTLPPDISISWSQITDVELGGTNMLLNSRDFSANWQGSNRKIGVTADPFGGNEAYSFQGTEQGNCYLIQYHVFKHSGKYVISFWAKADRPYEIAVGGRTVREIVQLTTEWQRYEIVLDVVTDMANENEYICFGSFNTWKETDVIISFYRPKVEEGIRATAWSPSPNDTVAKNEVLASINASGETVTISASKIDLEGLVNANEFTSKFATVQTLNAVNANFQSLIATKASIDSLNSSNARIASLEADHVSVSQLNAVNAAVSGKLDASRLSSEIASLSALVARSISCDSYMVNYGGKGWTIRPMQATIDGRQVVILGAVYTG